MLFSAEGRRALVTGGGGGLGAAICQALALQGADVVVADIKMEMATAVARRIGEDTGRHSSFAVHLDVRDELSVERAMAEAAQRLGAPDILVNCAGIAQPARFETMSTADWRRMLSVHLDGTFFCTRRALGPMLAHGFGRVICLSSIVAATGAAYDTHYGAAKAGIEGLVRGLAREVGARGVTVNAIAPGFFDTPMNDIASEAEIAEIRENIPVGRLGVPAEVGALAVYLASDAAAYLTGQVVSPNGAFSYGHADLRVGKNLV